MNSTLLLAFALGVRHGTDPDHLTAIDGLTRIRPRASNGLLFAIGHGSVVTLLAGVGHVLAGRLAFFGPSALISIGMVNAFSHSRRRQTPWTPLPARQEGTREPYTGQRRGVVLLPLSRNQIGRLANCLGLEDVPAFMSEMIGGQHLGRNFDRDSASVLDPGTLREPS